jgi:hypothetical protein
MYAIRHQRWIVDGSSRDSALTISEHRRTQLMPPRHLISRIRLPSASIRAGNLADNFYDDLPR